MSFLSFVEFIEMLEETLIIIIGRVDFKNNIRKVKPARF